MNLDESNLLPSAVHPMAERIERKLRESIAIEHFVSVLHITIPAACVDCVVGDEGRVGVRKLTLGCS
jgi:hypothetical protein